MDSAALEAETRGKVSGSLSLIEVALAEWDADAGKPERLRKRIEYLRATHQVLSAWEKESLLGEKGHAHAMARLRRFSELCRLLERARPS